MTIRDFYKVWDSTERMYAQVLLYLGDNEEPSFEGTADDVPDKFLDIKIDNLCMGGTTYKAFYLNG